MFEISLPGRFALPSWMGSIVIAGIVILIALVRPSWADDNEAASAAAAVASEVANKQKLLNLFPDSTASIQATPAVIPQLQIDRDPSGMIATFQPNGSTQTAR